MKEEQRIHLQHYLLGKLGEPEREALAERYFIDEKLFDELLEVENELFDQYARDELSPAEKKQFAEYIHGLPDGVFKLATATALAKLSATEQSGVSVSSRETTASGSWWQTISGFFFSKQLASQYVLGGAILIAFVFVVYFYLQQRQTRNDSEQLQVSETEKNISNQDANGTNVRPEQNNQPQKQQPPKEKLAQVNSPKENEIRENPDKKSPTVSTIASFILTPALRSESTADKLLLKPETKIISFIVKLPSNEKVKTYRAVLQLNEGDGPIVLTKENLKPGGSRQNRQVILTVPTRNLTGNSYKLTLQGLVDGQIEIMPEYYFEIKRK